YETRPAFGLQAVALLSCALSIAALTMISVRVQASRSTIAPTAARAASAPADACVAPEGEDDRAASSSPFRGNDGLADRPSDLDCLRDAHVPRDRARRRQHHLHFDPLR